MIPQLRLPLQGQPELFCFAKAAIASLHPLPRHATINQKHLCGKRDFLHG